MRDEVKIVMTKAATEAAEQWAEAEKRVSEELGYTNILVRMEHIQNQIGGLQEELRELEATMHEKAKPASLRDYREAGLDVMGDHNGKVYSPPRVFDRTISTYWDCLVLKHLNSQVPFFQIHLNLTQLQHTMKREMLLCGNFQEARALYQQFHEKIGKAIGDDLPGLLAEVNALPALQAPETGD